MRCGLCVFCSLQQGSVRIVPVPPVPFRRATSRGRSRLVPCNIWQRQETGCRMIMRRAPRCRSLHGSRSPRLSAAGPAPREAWSSPGFTQWPYRLRDGQTSSGSLHVLQLWERARGKRLQDTRCRQPDLWEHVHPFLHTPLMRMRIFSTYVCGSYGMTAVMPSGPMTSRKTSTSANRPLTRPWPRYCLN